MQYDKSNNNFVRPSANAIPGWTPFQQLLSLDNTCISTVGYCPVIPQLPTSKDVVYTAMNTLLN